MATEISMAIELKTKVSIVIPTFRDWNRLRLCVEALQKQTYPKNYIEVIIVNNDPLDNVPKTFSLPENFRLIVESKPGSYAARNCAIRLATGEIMGFTDSDCIPSPQWVENAVRVLESKTCSRIAGKIELFYEDPQKPTNAELYEKVFSFKQKDYAEQRNAAVTGNMFTWKHVLDTVGYFNENLFSGGDFEWSYRAQNCGFNIHFREDVLIFHPARSKINLLVKKFKRVSGGHANLNKSSTFKVTWKFLSSLKPPFYVLDNIRQYGKDLSLAQKINVFLLRYYLDFVSSRETLLIALGKSSNRE